MKKTILIIAGLSTILFFGYILTTPEEEHDEKKIITHYDSHQNEFQELIDYFNEIVPSDKLINIEFESETKLFRLLISDVNTGSNAYVKWNVDIKNVPNEIWASINWNELILKELKKKLDKAGCIYIASRNPMEIGFQRTEFGMYSYYIADEMNAEKITKLKEDKPNLNFFENNVAWAYNGGTID